MTMLTSSAQKFAAKTLRGALLATFFLVPACGEGIWGSTSATAGGDYEPNSEYNFTCTNRENWVTGVHQCAGPGNGVCLYEGPDSGYHIPSLNACALISDPSNWEADDAVIREACSERCKSISTNGYLCEDENWIDITTTALGGGLQACANGKKEDLDIDAFATKLGDHVIDAIDELDCDLNLSCATKFSGPIAFALATGASPAIAAEIADTQGFATLSEGAKLGGDRVPLQGTAAYSVPDCDAASCPIYLGDLSLTAQLESPLGLPDSDLSATAASVQLAAPTLGIWIPADGSVIFPARSLRLTTSAGVADASGAESEINMNLVNEGPVYGRYADGALRIDYALESGTVPWSLSVTFEP